MFRIKQYLAGLKSNEEKISMLREFLQLEILEILSKKNYFKNIAFVGGTALRILYKIERYSEDLDFSLINDAGFDFEAMVRDCVRELELRNIQADLKCKRSNTLVSSCFMRFTGLLYQLDLSNLPEQKISIKFEFDENPPSGFNTEISLIAGRANCLVNHFDRSSLFSGKLHVILARPYTKGRDYFDLLWFVANEVKPNLELLTNALKQTGHYDSELDHDRLKMLLLEKISKIDFKKLQVDLEPFLIDPNSLEMYQIDTIREIIEKQF